MTDREMLELAAKAYWGDEIDDVCSIRWLDEDQVIGYTHGDNQDHNGRDIEWCWNPLDNDCDALLLAVRLRINLEFGPSHVYAINTKVQAFYADEESEGLLENATRNVIVRAAAEIGRLI